MLSIKGVRKSFDGNEVLKGIDLDVEKGDVISIIGKSGSGKTTLLRCMNYLETVDEGTMIFDGKEYDMKKINHRDIAAIRKKTAFVFQGYNLFANKTALENVTIGLTVARKVNKEEAIRKGKELLDKVGLSTKYDSYPSELSGGQQQRVAIARALATDPEIIYFDEPTSALDPELIGEVLDVMKKLADDGMTMLIVTHEMNFAKNVSKRTILVDEGQILESGESRELFENPQNEKTKQFLRAINRE